MATKLVGRPPIEITNEQIMLAFKKHGGSLRKGAKELGISHMTFKRRVSSLGLIKHVTIEYFHNGTKI